jgi:hypothetical protein
MCAERAGQALHGPPPSILPHVGLGGGGEEKNKSRPRTDFGARGKTERHGSARKTPIRSWCHCEPCVEDNTEVRPGT